MNRARPLTILLAVIANAALLGCSRPILNPPTSGERAMQNIAAAKTAINNASDQWSKAIAAKDLDQCVAVYENDAVLFAPNAPAAVGKDAIRAAWKQLLSAPQVQITFPSTQIDVARSADLAVQRGAFQAVTTDAKGKSTTQNGRFVIVWQKQADGTWKVMADTNASNNLP
ncbi:MAG TPA: SgcJ/EcaC family oxidoreductase [Candidatus Dormibacteraeota bacterium]|nr:SgcJ/EcaC family oxidoreductase [Candidatus Dormibacteraeota bacterium]